MSLDLINVGTEPNDGTGDPPRVAALKINSNFEELYQALEALGPLEEEPGQSELDLKAPLIVTQGTTAYGATVNLNMATLAGTHQTISLTGNIAFTSSNRGTGRQVVLRLLCDSTQRTLSFPAGWRFLGSKPATIAASKVGVLSLTFFGENDSDGLASWGVES